MISELGILISGDASKFKSALKESKAKADAFKKDMGGIGMANIAQMLTPAAAVAAMLGGFSKALNAAQAMRDKQIEIGGIVDKNVASAARMGDTYDKMWDAMNRGGVQVVGAIGKMDDAIADGITRAAEFFGVIREGSTDAANETIKSAEKMDKLFKAVMANYDPKAQIAAEEKIRQAREASAAAGKGETDKTQEMRDQLKLTKQRLEEVKSERKDLGPLSAGNAKQGAVLQRKENDLQIEFYNREAALKNQIYANEQKAKETTLALDKAVREAKIETLGEQAQITAAITAAYEMEKAALAVVGDDNKAKTMQAQAIQMATAAKMKQLALDQKISDVNLQILQVTRERQRMGQSSLEEAKQYKAEQMEALALAEKAAKAGDTERAANERLKAAQAENKYTQALVSSRQQLIALEKQSRDVQQSIRGIGSGENEKIAMMKENARYIMERQVPLEKNALAAAQLRLTAQQQLVAAMDAEYNKRKSTLSLEQKAEGSTTNAGMSARNAIRKRKQADDAEMHGNNDFAARLRADAQKDQDASEAPYRDVAKKQSAAEAGVPASNAVSVGEAFKNSTETIGGKIDTLTAAINKLTSA